MDKLVERVLKNIFIELEASGRHVHVTREQAIALFGHPLTPKRPLSQPGQYLANERVTVKGPKGEFRNVAVLGPERKAAQIEISLTDGKTLGITPPVRLSGDVAASPGAVLETDMGRIVLDKGVIAAQRHIHITPEDAVRFGVRDKDVVKLRVFTDRPLVFENVAVRVSDQFATVAHLDYDEANACGFVPGDLGRILK